MTDLGSLGAEVGKWIFAQDLGETFPDRTGNGWTGTNGLDPGTDEDNADAQQLNRGLYFAGTSTNYVWCPSTKLVTAPFTYHVDDTTDYSIAWFAFADYTADTTWSFLHYCGGGWVLGETD